MPTNRTRRTRAAKPSGISPALRDYFETGSYDNHPQEEQCEVFLFCTVKEDLRAAWENSREEIIADWIKNNPCSRPCAWWEFDAPKEPVKGWEWDHKQFDSAQRRRLSGTGTPQHEVTCSWGGFNKGIPQGWVHESQVEYYNGRAKDIHGNIIPTEYKEGDFEGVAIDPEDPPVFESVAAYLQRHDLLTEAEKRHIEKHPELLKPEIITIEG